MLHHKGGSSFLFLNRTWVPFQSSKQYSLLENVRGFLQPTFNFNAPQKDLIA